MPEHQPQFLKSKTGILLFIRDDRRDAKKWPTLPGHLARDLSRGLTQSILKTLNPFQTSLPLVLSIDGKLEHRQEKFLKQLWKGQILKIAQQGKTFEEKFLHSLSELKSRGLENVIAIGNDTPGLNYDDVSKTIDNLSQNHVTIGPSGDGGFYLLGCSLQNTDLLKGLPWQKSKLNQKLKSRLSGLKIPFHLLDYKQDLDSENQLKGFARNFYWIERDILYALNNQSKPFLQTQVFLHFFLLLPVASLKTGPPA